MASTILCPSRGRIRLDRQSFVAAGGEGDIHVHAGSAYKIYRDPAKALTEAKLRELAQIDDPDVIVPEEIVLAGGRPVGYRMRFVADAVPLSRLLTRAYRQRHGLSPDRIAALVGALRERIASAHRAGCLVVDASEQNFVCDADHRTVMALDTDSYQTPSFAATALTPSVADPRIVASGFDEGSDWYAFAVLAFQLFTAIHPFKGKHPQIKGLAARMQARLSVLSPGVVVPAAALSFDAIAPAWRDWFERVFHTDERPAPPLPARAVPAPAPVRPMIQGDAVWRERLQQHAGDVRQLLLRDALWTVVGDALFRDGQRVEGVPGGAVLIASPAGRVLVASLRDGRVVVRDPDRGVDLDVGLAAEQLCATRGRLYAKAGERVVEVVLHDLATRGADAPKVITSSRTAVCVLPHATQLFDGLAVQDIRGARYLSLLCAPGRALQAHVRELDGLRIVSAAADGPHALVITQARDGGYQRHVISCREQGYRHRATAVSGPLDAAIVLLDSGLAIARHEDGLELFAGDKSRIVATHGCDLLGHHAGTVVCAEAGTVYRISLQAPAAAAG